MRTKKMRQQNEKRLMASNPKSCPVWERGQQKADGSRLQKKKKKQAG